MSTLVLRLGHGDHSVNSFKNYYPKTAWSKRRTAMLALQNKAIRAKMATSLC